MADGNRVRIEVAFEGGQVIGGQVSEESLRLLEEALGDEREGTVSLEIDDGQYVVVLRHVVYAKRFARESRVGFGSI